MFRILLAEDNEDLLERYTRCLEEAGHMVTTAVRLRDAALLLKSETFDLIISDNQMPIFPDSPGPIPNAGEDLARRRHRVGISIPFILHTSAKRDEVELDLDKYDVTYLEKDTLATADYLLEAATEVLVAADADRET